jgi:hypothetical protein
LDRARFPGEDPLQLGDLINVIGVPVRHDLHLKLAETLFGSCFHNRSPFGWRAEAFATARVVFATSVASLNRPPAADKVCVSAGAMVRAGLSKCVNSGE